MNQEDPNKYIIIPNPIYDVVFKYLMEDLESARIFLSTLLNYPILHLQFSAISHAQKLRSEELKTEAQEIRLFHLDFTALIELPNGQQEMVMIELQKANVPSDIFRFKRYIAANFQKKQKTEAIDLETQSVKVFDRPIRLLPIFILNFRIEKEINELLIKTSRIKRGVFKEQDLQEENEFIDNLSYDMWVIQLPNLVHIQAKDYAGDEYKRNVYALLKLFDQKAQQPENRHRLQLIQAAFPKFLKRVINRLKAADANYPALEEQMHVEDEYLAELTHRANKISFFKQALEKTEEELEKERQLTQQKEQELERKDRELKKERQLTQEKEQELKKEQQLTQKKEQELQQKEQELGAKDQALKAQQERIYDLARILKANGVPPEVIEEKTGLSRAEIEEL